MATGFVPMLLTIATLALLSAAVHLGPSVVVLGAAVCLTSRPGRTGQLVAVLATGIAVTGLAVAFGYALWLGDVVYLLLLLGARLAGLLGPRWAALGRTLLLPVTALFIAPPVRVPGEGPATDAGWALIACLVASLWLALGVRVLREPGPHTGEVVRAATGRWAATGTAATRHSGRLDRAVARLDAVLAREGNDRARAALLDLQVAVESAPERVPAAVARLEEAVPTKERGEAVAEEPEEPPSARARARLAMGSTLGVALALAGGQLLFPTHWPWTVITVITVSLSARSRGEVLVRSGQRLLGALGAAAIVSPLAGLLAPYPAAVLATMLAVLGAGWYLRDVSRVWWTAAMTATLALIATLVTPAASPWALLGDRLAAIAVGGACAILPALVLAPRSRDLLRRRAGTCLRRLRACLDEPSVAALRRFELALAELAQAGRPLRILRRRAPQLGWHASLAGAAPQLRAAIAAGEPPPPAVRRLLRDLAGEVRTRA